MAGAILPDDEDEDILGGLSQPSNVSNISTTTGQAADQQSVPTDKTSSPGLSSLATPQAIDRIASLNKDAPVGQLFKPLEGLQGGAKTGVSTAFDQFKTAAGDPVSFGDTQRSTLSDALRGVSGLEPGRALLGTSYTGPASVNEGQYSSALKDYGQKAREVSSPNTVSTYLGGINPAATPGALNFDTQIMKNNPMFKQGAKQWLDDFYGTAETAAQNVDTSKAMAGDRVKAATDFVTGAKNYVTTEGNKALSDVDTRLAGQKQQASDLDALYKAIVSGQAPLSAAGIDKAPQSFSGYEFNASADPTGFVRFNSGAAPNRNTAATSELANIVNNAEALLGENDVFVSPQDWNKGSIGFDDAGWQGLLGQLAASMAAANARRPVAPPQMAAPVFNQATQTWYDAGGGPGLGTNDGISSEAAEASAAAAAADASAASAAAAAAEGNAAATGDGSGATGGNGVGDGNTGEGGAGGGSAWKDGGLIDGPGGPREDKIKARLSDGEYVVNAKAVETVGKDFLDLINSIGKDDDEDEPLKQLAMKMAKGGMVRKGAYC